MGVAQRYNKILIHNSFGTPRLAKYDMQFSASGGAGDPENVWPGLVFDAVAAGPKPPKTVAIVTSKFPSVHFISVGAREVAKKRGLNEVLFLEFEFGNRDFGAIASRVKDAKPDFVFVGAIGLDGVLLLDAMKKIDYQPPMHFYTVPGARPDGEAARGDERARAHHLRGASAVHRQPRAARFVKAFHERAAKAALPSHLGRPASVDRVRVLAGARGGGQRREELRRQGARAVAEDRTRSTPSWDG